MSQIIQSFTLVSGLKVVVLHIPKVIRSFHQWYTCTDTITDQFSQYTRYVSTFQFVLILRIITPLHDSLQVATCSTPNMTITGGSITRTWAS